MEKKVQMDLRVLAQAATLCQGQCLVSIRKRLQGVGASARRELSQPDSKRNEFNSQGIWETHAGRVSKSGETASALPRHGIYKLAKEEEGIYK